MAIVTDALVLKVSDVGESDRVLTLLSSDLGIIRAFANRAKKVSGRLNAGTQTFCYGSFSLYPRKDSYSIDSVTPKEVFFGLRDDISKLALGQYFCSLALDLVPEGEPAPDSLRVILNSLSLLVSDRRTQPFLKSVTELKMLSLAGFAPNLVSCGICGDNPAGDVVFDADGGRFYCKKHGREGSELSAGALTAMRHVIANPVDKIYSFSLSERDEALLSAACETFALTHLSRNHKALEFYKTVCPSRGAKGE